MRHPSITANCVHCGIEFHPLPSEIKKGIGRFCSAPCAYKGKYGTVEEQFWRNVTKGDGCWTYKRVSQRGYGKIRANGKHLRAHRLSWEMANGPIPVGLLVCHSCDNPSCIRPDHLFLGTNADNAADRNAKGRTARGPASVQKNPARGERSGMAVLTTAKVKRIRRLYATGHYSQQAIADVIGIDQTHISRVVRGVAWAHVKQ